MARVPYAEFIRAGSNLILSHADGSTVIIVGYFSSGTPANLVSANGAIFKGDIVDALAGLLAPGQVKSG